MFPAMTASKFAEQYSFVRHLGTGNFGDVSLYTTADAPVAIKKLKLGENVENSGAREVRVMSLVNKLPRCHANLSCYIDSFRINRDYYIVTLFVEGLSLEDHINGQRKLLARNTILDDVLHGLEFLHRNGFAHVDVKPKNIMVAADRAVLIDLGLACVSEFTDCYKIGTVTFMSPELLHYAKKMQPPMEYTPPLFKMNDLYSVGLVMYCMARKDAGAVDARYRMLGGVSSNEVYLTGNRLLEQNTTFSDAKLTKLMRALLVQRYTLRPNAADARKMLAGAMEVPSDVDFSKPVWDYLTNNRKRRSTTPVYRSPKKPSSPGYGYYAE